MKTEYQNYLFDLYGTLVDIHTDEQSDAFWQSVQGVLAEQGAVWTAEELKATYCQRIEELEARAKEALGDGFPEIDLAPVFREFLKTSASDRAVAALAEQFRMLSMRKLRLFDGAKELLVTLRAAGKGVYLLSNAQSLFTMPELKKLGLLECFDGVLLSSEAGRKKPDPLFYGALLQRWQLDAGTCIMVGNDDVADCHGAAAAGLDSLYVRTEQSPSRKAPLPENCREITAISQVEQTLHWSAGTGITQP